MNSKKAFLFTISFSAILFFANIWGLSIYSLDEAKNSECAREMLEKGDFIVPTFNYEIRTDKPPMHYYFMIFAYKLFGVNEFSARFFSAFFGVLTVLITFLFARRYYGLKIAVFSVMVLLSSLHLSIQFHMAVPDPYLIFFITSALFSFYLYFKESNQNALWLFYVFMGFGVLTKGPIAIVLPSLIALIFMIYSHRFNLKEVLNLKPLHGFLVVLAIFLPWYIAVGIKTDWVWIKEFIFKHNLHRFSDSMEGHGGIFLVTFLFVFIGLLPFSIYILQTIRKIWKEKYNDASIFLFIWAIVYIGFFAISKTKLPNYTVPSYPALSILFGLFLANSLYRRNLKISLFIYIIFTVILSIGAYLGLRNEEPVSDLSFIGISFLFLTASGIMAFLIIRRSVLKSHFILATSSFIFILSFFYILFPPIDKRNPVNYMLSLIDESKPIATFGGFNPAFSFYLKKPIKKLKNPEEVKQFLASKERIYILTRKSALKYLKDIPNMKILAIQKDLFEKKTSVLISNK